eukprot:CAMPEP_0181433656 /NCGR_PEP_ID=MMETSP1110-20121109/19409_1 /TAXON_ID=174948 /ORGANISM="Symbiodinium sp., Strain CCMP421" /LENGTH=140 /DNA_ID=CAMNT_0023557125 /DNA_START=88 /DNA_END=510 /DNA_ORIENTATION=-
MGNAPSIAGAVWRIAIFQIAHASGVPPVQFVFALLRRFITSLIRVLRLRLTTGELVAARGGLAFQVALREVLTQAPRVPTQATRQHPPQNLRVLGLKARLPRLLPQGLLQGSLADIRRSGERETRQLWLSLLQLHDSLLS